MHTVEEPNGWRELNFLHIIRTLFWPQWLINKLSFVVILLENIDAANNPQQKKSKELKSLVSSNKPSDSYRYFYPHLPGYTFIRNNAASRLDYIFVIESDKSKILDVNIVPVPSSDHVPVCVDLLLDKNSAVNKTIHNLNY